jgi:glucose/mannose transport system substrate-binding protein
MSAPNTASVEGQQAFNTRKGSIPARSADPADYPAYQRAAIADFKRLRLPAYQRAGIADFKRLRLVPSCANGSACTRAQTVAAISAVGRFSSPADVADLQAAIAAGVAAYRAGAVTR